MTEAISASIQTTFVVRGDGAAQATRVDKKTDSYQLLQFDNSGTFHALSASRETWMESLLEFRPEGRRLTICASGEKAGSVEATTYVLGPSAVIGTRIVNSLAAIKAAVPAEATLASMQSVTSTTE